MTNSDAPSASPPYVVLDSNVWIKELALQSTKASAVRYFLKTKGAKLVVPQVVRLEVEENLRKQMIENRVSITKAHRALLQLMGAQRGIVLPTDEEIDDAVSALIDRTGVDILDVPLTLDAALSSFAKVRGKVPPSHRNQQFADGVVWAHCLELLEDFDVFFVTADKAFFKDHDVAAGLAPTLIEEARHCRHRITAYGDLAGLMEDIRTEVAPDDDDLIDETRRLAESHISAFLVDHQFSLGRAEVLECKAFITETPHQIYLQVTVVWRPLVDETTNERCDARLTVVADGKYVPAPIGLFSDGHLNKVTIDYTETTGVPVHRGIVFGRGTAASIGSPATETHMLRVNPDEI